MSLVVENISKRYGKRFVVKEVNLEVKKGEIVGLLGPNGAGKTTTFHIIMGFVKPDYGRISFLERDITFLPSYQRARLGISYLTQEPSVFFKLSVEDNLKGIMELLGYEKKEIEERVSFLLNKLGLDYLRKEKAKNLSGGERRKLEIARALTIRPHFLLLDEPFTGIDPIFRSEIQEIILNLKKEEIGVLITDHNVRETLEITDYSYLIYAGEILFSGTKEELINDEKVRKVYLGEKFRP
ncbi:MAG: LPS export ABC transporter ATP-binding protein [candidate division WOR-3 bacterium]|nr:LPS export ABC transporter ATP-binding protein [candidate division WOR-3 bacterium]MCX7837273.1 LPS export ABC transporter ATP-binding protein [candidate division WOR-3 bacterium]MDW8113722.1 LPS export ABC transporter ATP-binding protein [candidate division WOR-3 bacterium]